MIRCLNCGRLANVKRLADSMLVRCCETVILITKGGSEAMTQTDYERRVAALRGARAASQPMEPQR